MNYAIALALILLLGLLTLVSYVDRLYSEIGKFLSREFQDNIDAFEQNVEPRLIVSRERASAEQKAASEEGGCLGRAARTAIAYSEALDSPGGPGFGLRAQHALFDRLVYAKLRAALGGRAGYAVSGGAALTERLCHFFRGVGVGVLQGYGLTETTAAATVNRPDRNKIGTVGQPLPGVGIKIAEDGEILIRGGIVFPGYWHNDEAAQTSPRMAGCAPATSARSTTRGS